MRSKEIYRRIYMSTKEAKQMDKALFDFYATCNPACTCDDRRMCNTIDHYCGSGRNFTGRFRDLNTGSTGDVGTDDITAIVSIY